MRDLLLLSLVLLCFTAKAQSRKHQIDAIHDKCIEKVLSEGDGAPGPGRNCDHACLVSWQAEMKRLLAKVPSEQAKQANWESRLRKATQAFHLETEKGMGKNYVKTSSETDAIGWMKTQATRRRVATLTKILKGQPFVVPSDADACDIGAGYLPKFGL